MPAQPEAYFKYFRHELDTCMCKTKIGWFFVITAWYKFHVKRAIKFFCFYGFKNWNINSNWRVSLQNSKNGGGALNPAQSLLGGLHSISKSHFFFFFFWGSRMVAKSWCKCLNFLYRAEKRTNFGNFLSLHVLNNNDLNKTFWHFEVANKSATNMTRGCDFCWLVD